MKASILALLHVLVTTRGWLPVSNPRRSATSLFASKFSQPAFRQSAHQPSPSNATRSIRRGGDSSIAVAHAERLAGAGRVGTKRYVNPCKIFLGNLPYSVDEAQVTSFLEATIGLPASVMIHDLKIIRDWKTSTSKGYGFCVFTDPELATMAIEKCRRAELGGRRLSVDQGVKRSQVEQLYLKKKKKPAADAESQAIASGIDEAEEEEEEYLDEEEAAMLSMLDPDLVPPNMVDEVAGYQPRAISHVTESDPNKNRAARRSAARQNKRRKPPTKGFGS